MIAPPSIASSRSSTPSCGVLPDATCVGSARGTRFRPRRSSTRPSSGWWMRNAVNWQNRAHFFGISARVMRQVLVDFAREHGDTGSAVAEIAACRWTRRCSSPTRRTRILVALDEALNALADVEPEKEPGSSSLRFFGGLSIEEAALVLEVSAETVKRDCRLAKAWLLRWLTEHETR